LETLGKISSVSKDNRKPRLVVRNGRVELCFPKISLGELARLLERVSQSG